MCDSTSRAQRAAPTDLHPRTKVTPCCPCQHGHTAGPRRAPGSWLGCTGQHSYIQPGKTSSIHFRPPLPPPLLPWRSCSSDELMERAPHNHSWGSCPVHSRSSSREEGNSSNLSPTEEVTEKPIKENISNRRMELVHLHQELLWGLQENFGEHQP